MTGGACRRGGDIRGDVGAYAWMVEADAVGAWAAALCFGYEPTVRVALEDPGRKRRRAQLQHHLQPRLASEGQHLVERVEPVLPAGGLAVGPFDGESNAVESEGANRLEVVYRSLAIASKRTRVRDRDRHEWLRTSRSGLRGRNRRQQQARRRRRHENNFEKVSHKPYPCCPCNPWLASWSV